MEASQGQGVPDPVYGEERTHRYGSGALLDLPAGVVTTNKGEMK
jgi:hypothetical protein